jgi:hypothetical protein
MLMANSVQIIPILTVAPSYVLKIQFCAHPKWVFLDVKNKQHVIPNKRITVVKIALIPQLALLFVSQMRCLAQEE